MKPQQRPYRQPGPRKGGPYRDPRRNRRGVRREQLDAAVTGAGRPSGRNRPVNKIAGVAGDPLQVGSSSFRGGVDHVQVLEQ